MAEFWQGKPFAEFQRFFFPLPLLLVNSGVRTDLLICKFFLVSLWDFFVAAQDREITARLLLFFWSPSFPNLPRCWLCGFIFKLTVQLLNFSVYRCPRLEGACTANPCRHGGTCLDHWSWQQCQCVDGFTGKYCEKCKQKMRMKCFLRWKICLGKKNTSVLIVNCYVVNIFIYCIYISYEKIWH